MLGRKVKTRRLERGSNRCRTVLVAAFCEVRHVKHVLVVKTMRAKVERVSGKPGPHCHGPFTSFTHHRRMTVSER